LLAGRIPAQAKIKWLKWKQEAENPAINFPPTDSDGPEHSPFRMWIRTRTKLNFQEAEERAKIFQMREKERKDMTQAEIDAEHKRLLMDHQTVCGASAAARTPEEMAKFLASAGHGGGSSSGAFQGRAADIADASELVPAEADEAEEEQEEKDEDEEEEGPPIEAAPKKREAWFDWDKAVGSYIRAESTALQNLEAAVKTAVQNMESVMAQVNAEKYAELKPLTTLEYSLCRKRCDFLKLVVSDKASSAKQDLQELGLDKFVDTRCSAHRQPFLVSCALFRHKCFCEDEVSVVGLLLPELDFRPLLWHSRCVDL
jgi:hypothetical protein